MSDYTLLHAAIGGCLIGLASLCAAVLSGKVPGISGVFGRLFVPGTPDPPSRELRRGKQGGSGDKLWRVVFLAGLIGGAALSFALWESAALFRPMRSLGVVAIAALLVGFGTRLGKGCTSGHGVCGVATGAKDSIVATMIFVGVAMVTVLVYNRVTL
jgi:uncharacterized membrane protein YedE/YeeE